MEVEEEVVVVPVLLFKKYNTIPVQYNTLVAVRLDGWCEVL